MTLPNLRDRAVYWRDRLNLREWAITVRWMVAKDGKENVGHCTWNTERLTAEIAMKRREPDQESTLVHELLHLVMQGHGNYEVYDVHTERAINRIASALMASEMPDISRRGAEIRREKP
jgi:Zn-dependent peptidase ImmA (M78 family)